MKIPKFLRAMEHIDKDLILEVAEENRATARPSRKKQWVTFGAVAATFALVVTAIFALPLLTRNDPPLPPSGTTSDSDILPGTTTQSNPTQSDAVQTAGPSLPVGTLNATIALDVNPSLEIEIDENGRVIGIRAVNKDAELVIQDLTAYGSDLDAAVDAIMDAMVENGFISAEKNDILLSVDTADTALSANLRETLSAHIKEHLNESNIDASVLTQSYNKDEEPVTAGVSTSKSTLCRLIWDCSLPGAWEKTWPELAELSIDELNAIVKEAPHLLVENLSQWRRNYSKSELMSPQEALDLALALCGLTEEAISNIHIDFEMQLINRLLFYRITFESDGNVYDCDVYGIRTWKDSDGMTGTDGAAFASSRPVGSEPDEGETAFQDRYLSLEEVRTYPFALGLADEDEYYVNFGEDFFGILDGEPVFYIHLVNRSDSKDRHTYHFNALTGEYIPDPGEDRFMSWDEHRENVGRKVNP